MEVCVDSVRSAINAVEGGASRLEVCTALVSEGGLTPTMGLFKAVKDVAAKVDVPVNVMIRVRGGDDFYYSQEEIKVMEEDTRILKDAGADGFVFGALTSQGEVDTTACSQILKIIGDIPTTYHRAFDLVIDPLRALNTVVELGFQRILTNGGPRGFEGVARLVESSAGRIVVMPGGGITRDNLATILQKTHAVEFHASAKVAVKSESHLEAWIYSTDENVVKEMVGTYKSYMATRH